MWVVLIVVAVSMFVGGMLAERVVYRRRLLTALRDAARDLPAVEASIDDDAWMRILKHGGQG